MAKGGLRKRRWSAALTAHWTLSGKMGSASQSGLWAAAVEATSQTPWSSPELSQGICSLSPGRTQLLRELSAEPVPFPAGSARVCRC